MRYLIFLFFFGIVNAQQTDVVDFLTISTLINPVAETGVVKGEYVVSFKVLQATDTIYLDAVEMKVLDFFSNAIEVVAEDDRILLKGRFEVNQEYKVGFRYEATPKQTLYFTGDQIWTQGQGKYTSHWLPSIDDMNDKIEFDLQFYTEKAETVVANGMVKDVLEMKDSKTWQYDMNHPMSSYLVAFAMGDFQKKELTSKSGVPVELYISTKDTANWEPTYRYSKQIFDFLETEIGVRYPWQNYKQVPVRDFLYAGMENTTATIFSEAFVVDSIGFNDRNYVNVNAHELAHQWFGNLVTETSGTHHWLHEGFATYYALLAERAVFGTDYYYWKLYNSAEQLKALSDEGKGQSLLDPSASSLTFYEKGAWALHMLRELIGDEAFTKGIQNYLKKYSFQNVTTSNFLIEIKAVSTVDISSWEADWLQQTAFKAEQAYESLLKSAFITSYFQVSALRGTPLSEKIAVFENRLKQPNDYIGQEVVYQLSVEDIAETIPLYRLALESKNLFVRQSVASSLQRIPTELKSTYETLLEDSSYVTQEAALYHLWASFLAERTRYLDKMKSVIGFQNRNVRQLWLALALTTEGYKPTAKAIFKEELRNYTNVEFSFQVRELAFNYINEIGMYNEIVVDNLINASTHHNWRFRNSSRNLLDELVKNPGVKEGIQAKLTSYSEKEKEYLNRIFSK